MKAHFLNLQQAISHVLYELKYHGDTIKTTKWQGLELDKDMLETHGVYFNAPVPVTSLELKVQIEPTLPWAEDHFQERIAGLPLNPGEQYKNWPYYGGDSKFRNVEENTRGEKRNENKFSHTYMERYWPKQANYYEQPGIESPNMDMRGIRYEYGDLDDVINLLIKQPDTRQAYLPVWFPEDTGVLHGGRVPCTIGYHFMIRNHRMHIHYQIRACDALRHFRNDIYLTCRLLQHVWFRVNAARKTYLEPIELGTLTMDIISFHIFKSEKNLI